MREEVLLCDDGRLLSSFMRFVDSVRLNCDVRSFAQVSERGACACCGTGLRRGTPLRSVMVCSDDRESVAEFILQCEIVVALV